MIHKLLHTQTYIIYRCLYRYACFLTVPVHMQAYYIDALYAACLKTILFSLLIYNINIHLMVPYVNQ